MILQELYPPVYEELRVLAHRHRLRWHGHDTLDSIALVSEAYLKLAQRSSIHLKSRAHFLALAARVMRQILVDYARRCQAQRHGGDLQRVSFDELQGLFETGIWLSKQQADVLVALDEALQRLAQVNERQSKIVEYRFFGAMTIKETATALGIAIATVNRDWNAARTWLYLEIQRILEKQAGEQ